METLREPALSKAERVFPKFASAEPTYAGMTVTLALIINALVRKLEKHARTYDGEN